MGRKSTGTVRILKNDKDKPQWHAKWTRADGTRTDWEPLDPKIALDDLVGAKACAARMAPRIRYASADGKGGETVEQYAKRWLDDREGRVNSIRDDRSRMRDHIAPTLGPLDVRTFTRDDVEQLRDALDQKIVKGDLAWKTAASCWTLVTSMCGDMVNAKKRELRVRSDNPCSDVKPPERGSRKAKQYLYPSEFLQFVNCERVPMRWRRAVTEAIYLFPRDGELQALEVADVDQVHGVVSITKALNARTGKVESTKTGETRRFAIEATLLPLLTSIHEEQGGKGNVVRWHEPHMSRGLRRWLKVAKVDRAALHEGTPTQKPLTWHDLRATGLTWMAVRGDDPLKIKQRAGHSTFSTTELYIREAEAVRDGFGDVFPPLPAALLESPQNRPGAIDASLSREVARVFRAGHGSRTRAENEHETPQITPDRAPDVATESTRLETTPDRPDEQTGPTTMPLATSRGAEPPTVEVLRAKLDAAIVAEAWDAVKVIRERMKQVERAGVVDLAAERARRERGSGT